MKNRWTTHQNTRTCQWLQQTTLRSKLSSPRGRLTDFSSHCNYHVTALWLTVCRGTATVCASAMQRTKHENLSAIATDKTMHSHLVPEVVITRRRCRLEASSTTTKVTRRTSAKLQPTNTSHANSLFITFNNNWQLTVCVTAPQLRVTTLWPCTVAPQLCVMALQLCVTTVQLCAVTQTTFLFSFSVHTAGERWNVCCTSMFLYVRRRFSS